MWGPGEGAGGAAQQLLSNAQRCLAVVHRHGESDTDAGQATEEVGVGGTSRQNPHVVGENDQDADAHEPEHERDIPGR